MKILPMLVALLILAAVGSAQQQSPPDRNAAAFDKLKSLVGEWEGKGVDSGKEFPATTTFRLISGGSVVMSVIAPGTPHEMVTMFHRDGDDLLATHYCVASNQPRMRAVASTEPNVVAFEFKDGTNIAGPAAGHMDRVKFTFVDANHHVEEWTFLENGQARTGRFEFHRKQ